MFSHLLRFAACGLSLCLLLAGQSESNSKQRLNTIRDLGKKNPAAIPAIAEYLQDPDPDVRIEAVKAIIKLDTERSLDPLIRATRDNDPEVQIRATDGLVNHYVPGYVASGLTGPLTRGIRQMKSFLSSRNDQAVDPDVVIRPEVAEALAGEIRGGSSIDSRANGALAAGILRARPAVPALMEALRAKDDELLFQVLVALQKIHDPSAGPAVSTLAHDLDERIQITALETIGVLRSLQSAPDVRSALRDARNVKIRRAALEALAMLGIPGDRTVFEQYATNDDAELRAAALEGLGRIREPEDYPVLEKAYDEKDADWRVHLAAAFGLVYEGKLDISDFSPLSYLVESLDVKGRATTARAYLTELARRDDVRKALFATVPDATKDQKMALCSIFGATRNEDVVPVLTSLSKDSDPDVAYAASKALHIVQTRSTS